ncbi:flavin reductase family protein [Terrilactibacillus sp. S3-3]|nr:flavin reductase family protein [Terrilactibacillus sp. S3-3]
MTISHKENVYSMTANAFMSVSLDPMLVLARK